MQYNKGRSDVEIDAKYTALISGQAPPGTPNFFFFFTRQLQGTLFFSGHFSRALFFLAYFSSALFFPRAFLQWTVFLQRFYLVDDCPMVSCDRH